MNRHNIPNACVSFLLFFSSGIALASEPGTFDRVLSVSGPVVLDISTNPGGIKITKGSEGIVRVHAVIRPLYGRLDLGLAEESIRALQQNPPLEQTGNQIRIGYTQLDHLRDVSMTLEIQTPTATQVRAQTSSGGINIQGPSGPVTATTVSGHTEISDIGEGVIATSHSGGISIRGTGSQVSAHTESGGIQVLSVKGGLELQTQSGRIEVSDVSGDVRAITHSGGIRIDNAKGTITAKNASGSIDAFRLSGAVHAETKSGAIHISQIRPAPIRALTESGAIKVDLASQRGYTIDAQSHSGKVSGPITNSSVDLADAHRFRELLGAGGPLVDLDTRSSKIEVN